MRHIANTTYSIIIGILLIVLSYTPITAQGTANRVTAFDLSPDGLLLGIGRMDGTLEIQNLTTNTIDYSVQYSNVAITSIDWHPVDPRLAVATRFGVSGLFDLDTLTSTYFDPVESVTQVAWSPDGSQLALALQELTDNRQVRNVIRIQNTVTESQINLVSHIDRIMAISWHPDSTQIISGSVDTTAIIWDVNTGQSRLILQPVAGVIGNVLWSPDGSRVVTSSTYFDSDSSGGMLLQFWNPVTGDETASYSSQTINDMAWHPVEPHLAISDYRGTDGIRLINATTGELIEVIVPDKTVYDLAWYPAGGSLVYVNFDGQLEFYSLDMQTIDNFTLIDPATNSIIQPLTGGDFLYLDELAVNDLVVRAGTTPTTVGSVEFMIEQIEFQTNCPFGTACDTGIGQVSTVVDNTAPYEVSNPAVSGRYRISATPYSQANATGDPGDSQSISFIVEQSNDAGAFTLVNAATDTDIAILQNGDVISTATVGSVLNIRANIAISGARSVVFRLNGVEQRTDNNAPYALANVQNGDYDAWSFTSGVSYRLLAEVYDGNNGNGTRLETFVIHFTID